MIYSYLFVEVEVSFNLSAVTKPSFKRLIARYVFLVDCCSLFLITLVVLFFDFPFNSTINLLVPLLLAYTDNCF